MRLPKGALTRVRVDASQRTSSGSGRFSRIFRIWNGVIRSADSRPAASTDGKKATTRSSRYASYPGMPS